MKKKKKEEKIQGGVGWRNAEEKRDFGGEWKGERRAKEGKWGRCEEMDGVVERGTDQGKEWEEYFFDTPAPWGIALSFSSVFFFCDTLLIQQTERTQRESQSAGQN